MKTTLKAMLLSAVAAALMLSPAAAQFAPAPQQPATHATYRASVVALATAASATDFLTITGSATKTVAVRKVECTGIGSTAGTPDILGIKRSAANTGGTSTTPGVVPLDSNAAAGTAVVRAYTVNPSALGAAVGTVRVEKLGLPLAATGAVMGKLDWDFGQNTYTRPIILRGVAQTFALNGNAATLAAGAALDCSIEWTEF